MQTLVCVGLIGDWRFGLLVPHRRDVVCKLVALVLFVGEHFCHLSVRSYYFWFGGVLLVGVLSHGSEGQGCPSIYKANSALLQVQVRRLVLVGGLADIAFLQGRNGLGFGPVEDTACKVRGDLASGVRTVSLEQIVAEVGDLFAV